MSPIDLIRVGIEKADWFSVCEGYHQMTGEEVNIPQQKRLDDISLTVNGKTVWSQLNILDPDKKLLEDFEKTQEKLSEAEGFRPFVEQEEVYEEEETGGLFSTSKMESVKLSKARTGVTRELRQKFSPLKLQCIVCKNTFDVHPDLKPIRLDKDDDEPEFKCDSCAVKSRTKY